MTKVWLVVTMQNEYDPIEGELFTSEELANAAKAMGLGRYYDIRELQLRDALPIATKVYRAAGQAPQRKPMLDEDTVFTFPGERLPHAADVVYDNKHYFVVEGTDRDEVRRLFDETLLARFPLSGDELR